MGGILSRLKGERSLFATLQESYPTESISPYGEVTAISAKNFKTEWKELLEAEGVKIYVTSRNGVSCFLLRKVEHERQSEASSVETSSIPVQKPVEIAEKEPVHETEPEKPASPKTNPHTQLAWTPEERLKLKQLNSQRLSVTEIAEKLNRSIYSVAAELRHIPDYKPKYPRKHKKKPEENKPATETRREQEPDSTSKEKDAETSHADNELRELLEACVLLCDSDRKTACKILLNESIRMLESRKRRDRD